MSENAESKDGKAGYVYIFANPCIKGWVKIGVARNWRKRLKDYQTYAPEDFYPVATLKTADWRLIEKCLHGLLGASIPKKKEFFRLSTEKAADILKNAAEMRTELAGFERHDRSGSKPGAKPDATPKVLKGIVFRAAKKNSDVRVVVKSPDRYTVLKGSRLEPMNEFLRTAETQCAVSIRKARAALESDQNAVKNGVLLRDVDFGSSSRALAVMLGVSSMPGPEALLDKDGRPLKDYL